MKKKIILLVTVLSLLSCSKDDKNDSEKQLAINNNNLAGKWNFETITKVNGTNVTFHGFSCTTVNDYAEIFVYGKIVTYNYFSNCTTAADNGCSQFTLDSNNRLLQGGTLFGDARVIELTTTRLKIEFDNPKDLGFMCNITDAKSILFIKK